MVAVQATTSTLTADHFATDVAPRWGDLDAQGHVNNSLVADYLQEARHASSWPTAPPMRATMSSGPAPCCAPSISSASTRDG